jgi:hypothetical protein
VGQSFLRLLERRSIKKGEFPEQIKAVERITFSSQDPSPIPPAITHTSRRRAHEFKLKTTRRFDNQGENTFNRMRDRC